MSSRARRERVELWGSAFLASLGLVAGSSAGCSSSVTDGDGGGGSGAGSTGAGTPGQLIPCNDPQPVLVDGLDTGFVSCEGGWSHRPSKVECASDLPRPEPICGGVGGAGGGEPFGDCTSDADCAELAYGHCNDDGWGGCYCSSGCVTDADCDDGFVCKCGGVIGSCVPASCTSDEDCEGDALCSSYVTEPGCGGTAYQCQTVLDECGGDEDCGADEQCSSDGVRKVCAPINCAIGRPFVVAGAERLAPPATRSDWSVTELAPALDTLSPATRAKLARYWTSIGQMEHASIAAFARFALQLLALGAPPDLIVRTHEAMADETRHARLAFCLASAYAGRPLGPGRLQIDGALAETELADVLRTVIIEGCIGETVAAMEAREALAHVTDPALRFVFGEVARDESAHALLAWRAVGFLCELGGAAALAVVGDVVDDVRASLGQQPTPPTAEDEALLRVGYVSSRVRTELRRAALERVVLRGLEALVCGGTVDEDADDGRMTLV